MTFTTQAIVGKNGTLTVTGGLPFAAGEMVELVVRQKSVSNTVSDLTKPVFTPANDPTEGGKYPLRGTDCYYLNPFDSAWADDEWDFESQFFPPPDNKSN